MNLNRHQVRENAFKIVFAKSANSDASIDDIKAQVLEEYGTEVESGTYLDDLVEGVLEHQDELDNAISEYLKAGWTISRLDSPDRAILQVAVYEMKYTETPDKVVINEALELAKTFSDETARKFINGVLSKIAE